MKAFYKNKAMVLPLYFFSISLTTFHVCTIHVESSLLTTHPNSQTHATEHIDTSKTLQGSHTISYNRDLAVTKRLHNKTSSRSRDQERDYQSRSGLSVELHNHCHQPQPTTKNQLQHKEISSIYILATPASKQHSNQAPPSDTSTTPNNTITILNTIIHNSIIASRRHQQHSQLHQ